MSNFKRDCTLIPIPLPTPPPRHAFCPGDHHSSFALALEALDDYSLWVSETLLPIAFAWIEEHKEQVYATVSDKYYDDVAVVIAAAFEIVKTTDAYQRGVNMGSTLDTRKKLVDADPHEINPVWTTISKNIASQVKQNWDSFNDVLDGTIHWEQGGAYTQGGDDSDGGESQSE